MPICTPYVDTAIGRVTQCTSATRPTGSNRYAGKNIWETDTGRWFEYDGTDWVCMYEPRRSFTPTPTPGSGSFTLLGAVSGTFQRQGGICHWDASIAITTNGTAAGSISFPLPLTSNGSQILLGTGRENGVSGSLLSVAASGTTTGVIFTYNNAYPGASGASIQLAGSYRMGTPYL